MADKTYSGTVASDGTLTLTIAPTTGFGWEVSQVTIDMSTAPVGAICELRKNGALVAPFGIASSDVAAGPPNVRLFPGDDLTVEWSSCTSGDIGKAYAIYEAIR